MNLNLHLHYYTFSYCHHINQIRIYLRRTCKKNSDIDLIRQTKRAAKPHRNRATEMLSFNTNPHACRININHFGRKWLEMNKLDVKRIYLRNHVKLSWFRKYWVTDKLRRFFSRRNKCILNEILNVLHSLRPYNNELQKTNSSISIMCKAFLKN